MYNIKGIENMTYSSPCLQSPEFLMKNPYIQNVWKCNIFHTTTKVVSQVCPHKVFSSLAPQSHPRQSGQLFDMDSMSSDTLAL